MYTVSAQCSWKDLISMIHTNNVLRHAVFQFIQTRIKIFLCQFIPANNIGTFFDLIGDTNAALFSGIVRCIMSTTCGLITPDRFDLVIPSTVSRMPNLGWWMRFLTAIGYEELLSHDTSEDFPSCIRWSIWTKVSCIFFYHWIFLTLLISAQILSAHAWLFVWSKAEGATFYQSYYNHLIHHPSMSSHQLVSILSILLYLLVVKASGWGTS